ncbi:MAG: 4-(cytidine 5'-diphospho)-2-C-methyl-D-erythritol kinase [Planctomycetaceae bacterium]|nr:4-(cytidine 5'-diphospho)-2-C-methyl-D-erythritol kinase [Planctomycetaceae bacterium]
MWLTSHAPAKINLYFEVLRRLSSGYHEICSLAVPVSIYDTVSVRRSDRLTLKVVIPSEEKYQQLFKGVTIPEDGSNLVIRAARLLQEKAEARAGEQSRHFLLEEGIAQEQSRPQAGGSVLGGSVLGGSQLGGERARFYGADIILEKRIPAQAGLGGGSSDAALVLLLLNELWDVRLTREELAEIGAELGSDVPLFLSGFPVICRGRGEQLEAVAGGEGFPPLSLVVVKPPVGCSTPAVYRQCVPNAAADEQILRQMILDWRAGRIREMTSGLVNRLLEPACQVSPEVGNVLEMFRSIPDPCLGVSMTGSGSACFGICRDRIHAAEAAKFLEKHQFGTVFTAETHLSLLVSCVGSRPEF